MKTIELLCFCVQNHSFRIKYYVLRNNIVEKVLNLMQRREKYLVVAAVRFLRACVGLKDEFYNRYIIKNNLFAPVMKVFVANGDKYNLLNSAVLELVDFIRRENIKALVAHLVETYETMFSSVTYVDTFKLLKVKYEHRNQQEPGVAPSGEGRELVGLLGHTHAGAGEAGVLFSREAVAAQQAIETARRRRDGSMDKSEEDYFNSEDDEEENQMPALDLDGPGSPTGLPPLSGRFIRSPGATSPRLRRRRRSRTGRGENGHCPKRGDEEDAGKRPKLGVDADGASEEKPPEGEVSEPETEKEGGGADAGAE